MHFLAPILAAAAAAIAIPTLVLMYFLKLRRREEVVASTLLWKRAVRDLQVNAPFQRLRRNLLLLVQLLAMAAVLLALSAPLWRMRSSSGQRYVLLIDRSASMGAGDVDGRTRLDEAKRRARVLIDSLRGPGALSLSGQADQAMIIAFDDRAHVVANFTSDTNHLRAALASIEPSNAVTRIDKAIAVAKAHALSAGEQTNNRSSRDARIELFSDGRIEGLDRAPLAAGELTYHKIGSRRDNVGVVAMQARRDHQDPRQVEVFAAIANFGPAPVTCNVQVAVNGDVRAVRGVTIPALSPPRGGRPDSPGKVSVSFSLEHGGEGVVEVRHSCPDPLAADDAAWAVLPPPGRLTAVLVGETTPALEAALKACPLAKWDVQTPAEYEAMADPSMMAAQTRYDVVIANGYKLKNTPRGRYLIFGEPPDASGVQVDGRIKSQLMLDWRPRHPVMRFVRPGRLFAATAWGLKPPRDAEVLAEFIDGPAIVLVRREGGVFLIAGFDVMDTNWPFEPGFVLFCYNAMEHLGRELGAAEAAALPVGGAITLEGLQARERLRIRGPGVDRDDLRADDRGAVRYPRTDRAGVYTIAREDGRAHAFAVNLLSEEESDLLPADALTLGGEPVAARAAAVSRSNVPLWPWLAGAALALVCLEWWLYNARIRL